MSERDFTAEMLGERCRAVCAKDGVTTAGNKRTMALSVEKGMGSVSIEKQASVVAQHEMRQAGQTNLYARKNLHRRRP
jgi:hypothetical protein